MQRFLIIEGNKVDVIWTTFSTKVLKLFVHQNINQLYGNNCMIYK